MPDKCPDCPAPSADMDGFIVSGPGGAPRSEGSGVSSPEGPFVREAPQTGHFILKGKVSSSSPLPDVPEPGWAYEAAEAGTYGGVHATPGDLIWCAGVNPVRWRVAQSDFDGAVRSVSVQQVLSSGTKIATVTVDGQATDLFCNPSGLASVSASFECGGQTWYLSSHEVTGYVEDDNEYVVHAVAPALLDGDLSVDLSPTWVGGSESQYVLNRTFLLSNVPVYGDVCYRLARGYDAYTIFVSEGYEDIAPEDLVLFSLWARIDNYSMPAAGEEIELPINLIDYNNTGILPVTGIGASASAYRCTGRDRMVMHEMPDQLSASPLKFYATGPASGYIGSLRVEKNSAFDWSRYESGAKLTLASTSASGEEAVQEVDMSCLNDRLTSVSASFGCSSNYAVTGSSSITVGTDMMYYADDAFPSDFCDPSSIMTASLAGGSFEIRGTDYDRMVSACSTSATFAFILDSGAFGRISANDFAQFFNGSIAQGGRLDSMNGRLRFVLNSRSELTSQDPGGPDTVVSLSVYEAYPALTLTSAKADGTSSAQTVDMSCLVPPVFNGSADGLVPANSPATQTADLLSDDGTWMPPATDAEIDAIFA